MNPMSFGVATFIWLMMSSVGAANVAPEARQGDLPEAAMRSYAQNYKDMALAFCIGKAYASEPNARADAVATAGGLDHWSRYDLENSTGEIPKLVERYLARDYHSIQGPNTRLDLLKCIDMYHSKELSELVKRYVPKPIRNYRQDNPPPKP